MASAAEIANDLRARAAMKRCLVDDARSMNRAAAMLDQMLTTVRELEEAAQAAEDKYERYVYGDDLYQGDA